MSTEKPTIIRGSAFGGLWFAMFVVVKSFGTAFAGWSWWWIFLAIVPDLWLILTKLNLLS